MFYSRRAQKRIFLRFYDKSEEIFNAFCLEVESREWNYNEKSVCIKKYSFILAVLSSARPSTLPQLILSFRNCFNRGTSFIFISCYMFDTILFRRARGAKTECLPWWIEFQSAASNSSIAFSFGRQKQAASQKLIISVNFS